MLVLFVFLCRTLRDVDPANVEPDASEGVGMDGGRFRSLAINGFQAGTAVNGFFAHHIKSEDGRWSSFSTKQFMRHLDGMISHPSNMRRTERLWGR